MRVQHPTPTQPKTNPYARIKGPNKSPVDFEVYMNLFWPLDDRFMLTHQPAAFYFWFYTFGNSPEAG